MSKKVFIIAEIGSVHDGSFGNALNLVDAAVECKVDAVKFQTHIPQAETLENAPSPGYFSQESRFEYFQRTGFSLKQWHQIKEHCEKRGVMFMSSPFSEDAVDLLETINMEIYKIPSGEVTNLPMLQNIAKRQKPVILSSGMSSYQELDRAVETIMAHNNQLSILQCTSEYPCPYEDVGINVMLEMKDRYNLPVGLSDHTLTPYATYLAVSLGASIIERHFTFSRKMYGSDAKHSLLPEEMGNLVEGIRAIETMLEHKIDKNDVGRFQHMKNIFEKSLVANRTIPAGTMLTRDMIAAKKPGTGISAARLEEFLSRRVSRDIESNHMFSESDFD